ncbi:glycerophosphodiester phosphodiesterase family protein [Mesorhizobium sp. M1C.F.Ca.ET.193.01.1.1]|uniref:glycerophosphodiester phosphodiesterase family protein n=1 Tax=unclassified Mesorhizobium TaxID=325217 RepID=UPI000FD4E23F|nr:MULTISPECIES: glycerophosphodiester phosphodiesterase family protein [unclassified Mesorhizobium]TGT00364.1 glycerophosphodiester phosphodiesterase family protein [bacterium M00.F.Ca.ET.177.01.1.1]TGQ53770.1 glycerophosphodiester phosphodiesterase family protein [Mesorhizobium sp. M1C.F.Ca.ET.210.01.1.1]TGQ71803.1 glycerophosphodiester phosphodiesterase family protein [Mesorhizobium sp. M1C.F.Ca.ET.212.01.1.1]TGR08544.1 glycerophosphodiester phosphodiesterase family protein [Mesorhizobium sp
MRTLWLSLLLSATLAAASGQSLAGETRAAQILDRFKHANQWRDHVMIAAHRAGSMQAGKTLYAENSLAAVEGSIAIGAEIVEVDVRRAKEGQFVIMHDSWLDRTTTCKGEVVKYTLAELKKCRLVIEGTGAVTDETVSTLHEMLAATKDRILINLDNKLEVTDLPAMIAVARDLGMADQVIVKENLWDRQRIDAARAALAQAGGGFQFMPILADDAVHDAAFAEQVDKAFAPRAIELINWRNDAETLTPSGGPLFSTRMRASAVRGDWHLWADTYAIVNKPGGFLAGGRGDQLAVAASLPREAWGFWVDRGATIIQTDEPRAAIEWLTANGFRVPYTDEARPAEPAHTASIN